MENTHTHTTPHTTRKTDLSECISWSNRKNSRKKVEVYTTWCPVKIRRLGTKKAKKHDSFQPRLIDDIHFETLAFMPTYYKKKNGILDLYYYIYEVKTEADDTSAVWL